MKQYNIYKTTNLINRKYYWGVHNSIDENDGYLGSGIALNNAIRKYGKENFKRETKFLYDTSKEAFEDESFIVNKEMISRKDCYNEKIGGLGGSIECLRETRQKISISLSGDKHPNFGVHRSKKTKMKISRTRIEKGIGKGESSPFFGKKGVLCHNFGKHPSEETRAKLSIAKLGNKNCVGRIPWNKGKKCPEISERQFGKKRPKISIKMRGENNPMSHKNRELRKKIGECNV